MKEIIIRLCAAAACVVLGVTAAHAQTANIEKAYRSLSVEEFEKAIADSTVFRLDVRSEEERRDDGYIPGTVMIDVQKEDFVERARRILPNGRTIAVNCRSGRRSKVAAEKLVGLGYNVIELDEGFNAWKKAGKPIVKKRWNHRRIR